MPASQIDPAIRAAAIADLQLGEQPAVVAARYGLDAAQMRVWKQRYVTGGVTGDGTPAVTPSSRPVIIRPSVEQAQLSIAELVLENLAAKLVATQRIAEYVASNPAWLEKQGAADVGELFECIDRSAVAILDRMAAAGRPAAASGDDDPAGPDQRRPDRVD